MNLMVVAHTDDELLWGWKDLLNGEDWVVLCIFQQYNYPGADKERKRRLLNFEKTSELFGFKKIILDYVDSPYKLEIDNELQKNIKNNIFNIINNSKKIVTHNPQGEYGHYHHKIVSKIVTELVIDKNKLYYFSFDKNSSLEFTNKYMKSFNGYFSNNLSDKTVIGHKNLSKISKIVKYINYNYDSSIINENYPKDFLNCNLITFNKYI